MKFTNHALIRMQQRGIDESSVASAILNPDETAIALEGANWQEKY